MIQAGSAPVSSPTQASYAASRTQEAEIARASAPQTPSRFCYYRMAWHCKDRTCTSRLREGILMEYTIDTLHTASCSSMFGRLSTYVDYSLSVSAPTGLIRVAPDGQV